MFENIVERYERIVANHTYATIEPKEWFAFKTTNKKDDPIIFVLKPNEELPEIYFPYGSKKTYHRFMDRIYIPHKDFTTLSQEQMEIVNVLRRLLTDPSPSGIASRWLMGMNSNPINKNHTVKRFMAQTAQKHINPKTTTFIDYGCGYPEWNLSKYFKQCADQIFFDIDRNAITETQEMGLKAYQAEHFDRVLKNTQAENICMISSFVAHFGISNEILKAFAHQTSDQSFILINFLIYNQFDTSIDLLTKASKNGLHIRHIADNKFIPGKHSFACLSKNERLANEIEQSIHQSMHKKSWLPNLSF